MMTTKPSFNEEVTLWDNGYDYVLGVDEVGRGAFAGPVVAAGVIFPKSILSSGIEYLDKINDSKLLSAKNRELLSNVVKKHCFYSAISTISVSKINKIGILKASFCAFREVIITAYKTIGKDGLYILSDGFPIPYIKNIGQKKQKAIIKGDRLSMSIASASIIAKVYRDALMETYHNKYPHYNFLHNKGYGTLDHRNALKIHGLSKIHRTSFALTRFLPEIYSKTT